MGLREGNRGNGGFNDAVLVVLVVLVFPFLLVMFIGEIYVCPASVFGC